MVSVHQINPRRVADALLRHLDITLHIDQIAVEIQIDDGRPNIFLDGRAMKHCLGVESVFDTISKHNWTSLPACDIGLRFFSTLYKPQVRYWFTPINNMIISWVRQDGKYLNVSHQTYQNIIKSLDVSPPPVILAGKLNPVQRQTLTDFILCRDDYRRERYSGLNFSKMIVSIFPKMPVYASQYTGIWVCVDGEMMFVGDPDLYEDYNAEMVGVWRKQSSLNI